MIQLIAGFAIAALLTVLLGEAMSLSLSDDDRILLFVVLLLVQFALFALVMAIVDLVNMAKHQRKTSRGRLSGSCCWANCRRTAAAGLGRNISGGFGRLPSG
ncbi:MAG: hypothetical protein IPQ22_12945 [Rhodoferax sp.]|nr:hypothetical protein [Rhodoferax sp.]